jgi:hypothetical protein
MNDDYLDAWRYAHLSNNIQKICKFPVGENPYKKNNPLAVTYEIQMGEDIPLKFIKMGIICIEVLNKKITRVITSEGKVGVSIKDRRNFYDYDFGVTMAYTRAIDNDNGLDFTIPFSNEIERVALPEPKTKLEKKDMYKLIMYWIGDNPLTKEVSDYESMLPKKTVYENIPRESVIR